LLAVSQWLLLRGVPGLVAWAARIAAYGYAAFYTALDVLAGIAAGELTQLNAERGLQTDAVEVDRLFAVGNDLGEIGVWCFGSRAPPPQWRSVVGLDAARCQVRWWWWWWWWWWLPPRWCLSPGARISTGLGALGPYLPWPWGLGC
jgi:hypothetical protein